MRLITLNAWCGRALYPLMHFLRKRAPITDVFCLQEVLAGGQEVMDRRHPDEYVCGTLFSKIVAALPDFGGTFAGFSDDPHRMSQAMFIRRGLPVKDVGDFIIHAPERPQESGSRVFSARKLQYAVFDAGGEDLTIANYHGLWNGGPKTDTADRLKQSRDIGDWLHTRDGKKVLCGDFNLLPDTESVRILERGMRNLVRECGVQSTRTVLYRHYDNPAEPNFADYVFVLPGVVVEKFEVLPDIASDHAALYLDSRIG